MRQIPTPLTMNYAGMKSFIVKLQNVEVGQIRAIRGNSPVIKISFGGLLSEK